MFPPYIMLNSKVKINSLSLSLILKKLKEWSKSLIFPQIMALFDHNNHQTKKGFKAFLKILHKVYNTNASLNLNTNTKIVFQYC